jgi:hypothetical protein
MNDLSDQQLDELLCQNMVRAIDDDGFSVRVMRALPPRRPPRFGLIPMAVATGCALTWFALQRAPLWQPLGHDSLANPLGAGAALTLVVIIAVSALGCVWALEETR